MPPFPQQALNQMANGAKNDVNGWHGIISHIAQDLLFRKRTDSATEGSRGAHKSSVGPVMRCNSTMKLSC